MKRWIALFLLLCLLTGCSQSSSETETRSIDTIRSFKHSFNGVWATETEDTIYYVTHGTRHIMYVDKATGISGPLCAKPECTHDSTSCNAYVPDGTGGLYVVNDRLYWISLGRDGTLNIPVYCLALDGTGRLNTIYLDGESIPSRLHSYYYILDHDTVFIGTMTTETEDVESAEYKYIGVFPLDSEKESKVILWERSYDNILLLQYYKGYLYFITNDWQNKTNYKDGDPLLFDFRLRRWNEATGETEMLYEETDSLLPEPLELWVTDDGVYFSRNRDYIESKIFFYSFADKTCKEICNTGVKGGVVGIADDLISGIELTGSHGSMCDLHVVLKNFAGDVLVDDTYTVDVSPLTSLSGKAGENFYFIGRDEAYAYYTTTMDEVEKDPAGKLIKDLVYTAIVSVALDGSGARVLCVSEINAI